MRLDIRKDPGYEPYLFERSARFAGALLEAHEMDQIGAYLGVGHEVRVPETVRALALENDDIDIAPRRQIPLNFRRQTMRGQIADACATPEQTGRPNKRSTKKWYRSAAE